MAEWEPHMGVELLGSKTGLLVSALDIVGRGLGKK
jgi:hypothetical protein